MFAVVTFFGGSESKAEKLKRVNGPRDRGDMPRRKTHDETQRHIGVA